MTFFKHFTFFSIFHRWRYLVRAHFVQQYAVNPYRFLHNSLFNIKCWWCYVSFLICPSSEKPYSINSTAPPQRYKCAIINKSSYKAILFSSTIRSGYHLSLFRYIYCVSEILILSIHFPNEIARLMTNENKDR